MSFLVRFNKLFMLLICATIFLAACSDGAPEQPQAGDGWQFLTSVRSDFDAPGKPEVLTAQAALEEVLSSIDTNTESPEVAVDFDTEVVLVLRSGSKPVYPGISFTESSVTVDQWIPDRTLISDLEPWVTLFAIERSSLPAAKPFDLSVAGGPVTSIDIGETPE